MQSNRHLHAIAPTAFGAYLSFGQTLLVRLVVLSAFLLSGGSALSQTSVATDRAALVALYNATDGANWNKNKNTNWLSNKPLSSWHGVSTDTSGRVTRLDLAADGLRGEIPVELGSLSRLQELYLSDDGLSGKIPAELGNLTRLEKLRLSGYFSGGIPAELGNLTRLRYLAFGKTHLSGKIPAALGNLTRLEYLDLHGGYLSGEIPPELGNLTRLRYLSLRNNRLSGAIPAALGSMASLKTLQLDDNELSGAIPAELGRLTSLDLLYLRNNRLSGAIPAELGNLTRLRMLWLSNNELSGAIPAELGSLTRLHWLYLNDNALSGAIPAELVNLTSLRYFDIRNTRLCVTRLSAVHYWLFTIDDFSGWNFCATSSPTPSVSLSASPNPVAEGSRVRVTAMLSAALSGAVTVPLTLTRDTSEDRDHGTLTGIEIAAGFTSATAEIATNQDDDSDDERFTVALDTANLPAAVTAGSPSSVSVTIADDDTQQVQGTGYTVPAELVRTVRRYYEINRNKPSRGENWLRVLIAFGAETHATLRPFTAAEAEVEATKWSGWRPILDALRQLEAARRPAPDPEPAATPEVSIAAGPGVTEGQSATFTVTASPAPAAPLAVAVTVTESGGYAAAGTRTVTVPTSGTATFTVATVDDAVDEPDGSVRAALGAGSGYTVSSSQGAATVAVADDDVPEVSIAAGPGVTEGGDATFTVTAVPAPATPLTVAVTVTESGGYASAGTRQVTVPASGTATFTVATRDDAVNEPDGSVTATLGAGSGYTVSSSGGTATVAVSDDDEQAQGGGYTVPADLVQTVRHYYEINRNKPSRGENWLRVLIAFGAETHATLRPFTAAEAEVEATKWSGWRPILDALRKLEAAQEPAIPPATPEVSIAAGPGVTEGSGATFTVTAVPAPATALTVDVTVTESGGYATAGTRQVTVPTSGTATFTVATVDDGADEPDGSVTATLTAGSGYTVSSSKGAATVAVADDDETVPEVSISAGAGVTEGSGATFTVTAVPAPATPLTVAVTVTESGGYATAGTRQVTVPTSGTATFTVATVDDGADEPDGSVTATLTAGSGYTVSSSKGAATVAVADDDEPLPEISIAAGPAVTEGRNATFTLTAAPAPAADLAVAVAVSQSGAVAQPSALGARTVTIAAGTASAAFTVATVDDTTDEPDGSVTAALAAGAGYTVGTTSGAAVAVADNDDVALPAFVPKRGIAREGTDNAVVFAMRLSHASTETVTVDWATADGAGPWARRVLPATAGADYVAASGTLTFAAGETRKTVSVALLDDAIDEGIEYFLLRFSNLRGATVGARDREVEGIIRNDDHLQAMWLSRFGRTVGSQVTDAVSGRLEGDLAPGAHATLAGQPLDLSQAGDGKALAEAMAGLAQAFGAPGAPAAEDDPFARHGIGGTWNEPATAAARPVTGRELLLGSAFHLSSGGGGSGPGLAAWGRVAQESFDGEHADDEGRARVDGEVLTGVLGADADFGRLLAGVAVSLSEGEGTFDSPGVDRGTSGSIESTMTTVSPYARVKVTERVSAWGLAGWGTGDMTIGFDDASMAPVKTDLGMQLGALGARGALLEQDDAGGMDLALKADAFFVRTESDAAANSAKTEADASRLRLVLEGGRAFDMGNGATFRPLLELGVRHDGGDAETGAGVELGGGVSYIDAASGLSIEARARMLVAHADSDYREWGASATARLDPGADGRGLSLSLSPTIGTSGSATERLWGAQDARGLAPVAGAGGEFEAARGLRAEAGYGIALFGDRFTGTPNVGFGMADSGTRDWRIGWRLNSAIEGDPGFEVSLDATRREPANDNRADHALTLRGAIRW